MYIIRKGVVGCNGRIMGSGNYFGEDMILQSAVRLHDVRCLTYLDVYVLLRSDLDDILELGDFPNIYKMDEDIALVRAPRICKMIREESGYGFNLHGEHLPLYLHLLQTGLVGTR